MNAKQKIHQVKFNNWIALVQDQKESGLSIKDWCAERNLSAQAYYCQKN